MSSIAVLLPPPVAGIEQELQCHDSVDDVYQQHHTNHIHLAFEDEPNSETSESSPSGSKTSTSDSEKSQTGIQPVKPTGAVSSSIVPQPSGKGAATDIEPKVLKQLADDITDLHAKKARTKAAVATAERHAAATGCSFSELSTALKPFGVDLEEMKKLVDTTNSGVVACDNHDGWEMVYDNKLQLHYQHTPHTPVHSFKGSAIIDAPIEQLVCLVREFDLISTWNHYMQETLVLKEENMTEVVVYAAVWLPWPFSSRDIVVRAQGMDSMDEDGAFTIVLQSVEDPAAEGITLPASAAKRERVKILPGSILKLEPVAEDTTPEKSGKKGKAEAGKKLSRTRGTTVSYVDAGMPNVPNVVIQFVLRVFAPFMYQMVCNVVKKHFKDPKGPMLKRMGERPVLYQLVAEHGKQHLAETKGKQ